MKKLIVAIVLSLAAAAAFAMPKPSQIEDALAAHDYQSAKSMTQEVLREKPDSAKAHLFNAYVLLKADHNTQAAANELHTAASLDTNGKVKHSALFGRTVAELEATRVEPRSVQTAPPAYVQRPRPAPVAVVPQQHESSLGFKLMLVAAFTALALAAILLFGRPKQKEVEVRTVVVHDNEPERFQYSDSNGVRTVRDTWTPERAASSAPRYVAPAPVYERPAPVYSAPAYQAPAAPQRQGMGAIGTMASVAGGVVAGELLTDALRNGIGHHSHQSRDDDWDTGSSRSYDRSPAYEAPAPVSYQDDRSSFSSGGDDDWGSSSGSSGGGSDSWDDSSSSSSGSDSDDF